MNTKGSQTAEGNSIRTGILAALAAFFVYFCMYAFRKPFTAATLEGQELFGLGMKSVYVLAQLSGYMVSKFIGIKIVSEMPRNRRAIGIILLIAFAELALVAYAFVPPSAKVVMLFLNGLPLGMVFGLVLAYLEGRRHTEAMTAVLCASFIASSGFVKSVGRWLMEARGVSEFHMPYLTGLIFLIPLVVAVYVLDRTPDPTAFDQALRSRRSPMDRQQRWDFFKRYAPGLSLLIAVYVVLTIIRTVRDDFAVEIWRDLGVQEKPLVYARSETVVAIIATALNAAIIFVRRNITALLSVLVLMALGFGGIGVALFLQAAGSIGPFAFMVACGVGLYIPYVAFHTTVFERLVAASSKVANLGFLMYLADAIGYLGYAFLVFAKALRPDWNNVLSLFRISSTIAVIASILALACCAFYFQQVLSKEEKQKSKQDAASADPAT